MPQKPIDKYIKVVYNISMSKESVLKRVDYHLTVSQHEKLKRLAEKTGNSVSVHIRLAVDKYLKDKEREK